MKKGFLLYLTNLLIILPVFAQSELYKDSEDINNALSHNMYTPNYFSLFFGLFLVIGLVYLTGFIYQKLIKIKINNNLENKNVNIVSTTSLGQGKNIHIIEIQNKYMLIASTQNSITFLKDLDNDFIKEPKKDNA